MLFHYHLEQTWFRQVYAIASMATRDGILPYDRRCLKCALLLLTTLNLAYNVFRSLSSSFPSRSPGYCDFECFNMTP